jgi:hypothetical protein
VSESTTGIEIEGGWVGGGVGGGILSLVCSSVCQSVCLSFQAIFSEMADRILTIFGFALLMSVIHSGSSFK